MEILEIFRADADIFPMESRLEENLVEWEKVTFRLLQRVEELEALMAEVRQDLDRYRAIRTDWYAWHEIWKENQKASRVG